MEKVTISREEYERLKSQAIKMKLIDETIHEDLSSEELVRLQENQKSLKFLKDKRENVYTANDLKETWKRHNSSGSFSFHRLHIRKT